MEMVTLIPCQVKLVIQLRQKTELLIEISLLVTEGKWVIVMFLDRSEGQCLCAHPWYLPSHLLPPLVLFLLQSSSPPNVFLIL